MLGIYHIPNLHSPIPHSAIPPDTVLQFILDGLKIRSVASHAAKAVQRVCQKCKSRMAPHFDGLLQVRIPMFTFQFSHSNIFIFAFLCSHSFPYLHSCVPIATFSLSFHIPTFTFPCSHSHIPHNPILNFPFLLFHLPFPVLAYMYAHTHFQSTIFMFTFLHSR